VRLEYRQKTVCVCPKGKFKLVRMLFALANTSSLFQQLMEMILNDVLEFVQPYIDDIIIYT